MTLTANNFRPLWASGVEVSTFNLLKDLGSNPDFIKCHELYEVKEMKINWLDESPMTYKEAMELLNRTHSKRLEMEEKNKWDAFVNDFTFLTFVHDTYYYMLEEVKKEVDIDLNYFYPKIKDFVDLESILQFQDASRSAKNILIETHKENIWEIVEHWWIHIFKALY